MVDPMQGAWNPGVAIYVRGPGLPEPRSEWERLGAVRSRPVRVAGPEQIRFGIALTDAGFGEAVG